MSWLVANSMAAATVDVWGAISQLVDDPALLSVEQLAVLSQVLTYVPPTIGGDQSGLTALLLGTMDGKEGGRDVEAEYVAMKVMDELEHRVDEVHAGPGRGYSLWPRAPPSIAFSAAARLAACSSASRSSAASLRGCIPPSTAGPKLPAKDISHWGWARGGPVSLPYAPVSYAAVNGCGDECLVGRSRRTFFSYERKVTR